MPDEQFDKAVQTISDTLDYLEDRLTQAIAENNPSIVISPPIGYEIPPVKWAQTIQFYASVGSYVGIPSYAEMRVALDYTEAQWTHAYNTNDVGALKKPPADPGIQDAWRKFWGWLATIPFPDLPLLFP